MNTTYDAIIIGAGVAGVMAAYTLAAKGGKILILDRGEKLSAERQKQIFDSASVMLGQQIKKHTVIINGNAKNKYDIPINSGGLARFYAGISLRLEEQDFLEWPITYQEIEPYYSKAETLMNISGFNNISPSYLKRSKPYNKTLPQDSSVFADKLVKGANKVNMRPFRHPIAIDFQKCQHCDYCNQVPCIYGAKWSPDDFLNKLNSDNITFLAEHEVVKISSNQNEKGDFFATGVIVKNLQTAKNTVFHSSQIVLAAGAFITPTLLHDSKIATTNPHLGANLMTHCLGVAIGIFPNKVHTPNRYRKWVSFSGGYNKIMQNGKLYRGGMIQQEDFPPIEPFIKSLPIFIQKFLKFTQAHIALLLVVGEDGAQLKNKIIFVQSKKDQTYISHAFSHEDKTTRKHLLNKAKQILKKTGALFVLKRHTSSLSHICGTARMGASSQVSVTDRNGKVWGTTNIHIVDASLFPTSTGANPSLTIAANSLRIADLL